MTYEIAKKIKDAGFPISGYCIEDFCDCGYEHRLPTLSELIEACGDGFGSIGRSGDLWQVSDYSFKINLYEYESPEEAVANLWLELQNLKQDKGV